jgi:hypothetical protein
VSGSRTNSRRCFLDEALCSICDTPLDTFPERVR